MALWSNTDESASAPQFTVDVTSGNTGVQAYNVTPIGTFGVDTNEAQATNVNGHAGWVLRTEGSDGRAGRVTEETLVAMGSMTSDGSDDTPYPDARITIVTQPSGASVVANTGGSNTATLSVVSTAVPSSATLAYQWQYDNSGTWGNVVNATPANTTYTGITSSSLVIIPTNVDANASVYRVIVSSTGADSVTSANAVLTVTA
jgi:hypothetical protein